MQQNWKTSLCLATILTASMLVVVAMWLIDWCMWRPELWNQTVFLYIPGLIWDTTISRGTAVNAAYWAIEICVVLIALSSSWLGRMTKASDESRPPPTHLRLKQGAQEVE